MKVAGRWTLELVDRQEKARGTSRDRVADERLMVLDDGGNVAEPEPVLVLYRDFRELPRGRNRGYVLHLQTLVGRFDKSARARRRCLNECQGRHPQGIARGLDYLGE
jgi:hypothetical protein